MRIFSLFAFILLIPCYAFCQQPGKVLNFSQVAWTITIPASFILIEAAEDSARMARGLKVIEEANDIKVNASSTITLISAIKDKFNYFNSTITPFDAKKDGDYSVVNQELKNLVYNTMALKMQKGELDSVSSTQEIDGIVFDKFTLSINIPQKISFKMILMTKLYKGFSFGITYLYLDDKTKEEIETMLKNSKFDK